MQVQNRMETKVEISSEGIGVLGKCCAYGLRTRESV